MSDTPEKPPPGSFLDPYKDNNPLVTLESFIDPFKADVLRNRLLSEGIEAVVTGELAANPLGSVGTSGNTVKVAVHQSDVDRATRILAEPVEPAPGSEPIQEPDPSDPEYLAMRAWQSALVGVMLYLPLLVPAGILAYLVNLWPRIYVVQLAVCLPLLILPAYLPLYSARQAIRANSSSEQLSAAGSGRIYGALALDVVLVLITAFLALAIINYRDYN